MDKGEEAGGDLIKTSLLEVRVQYSVFFYLRGIIYVWKICIQRSASDFEMSL